MLRLLLTMKFSESQRIVIEPGRRLTGIWKEVWQYRELGLALGLRDLRVRYKDTFLGAAWAILQPLANMLIFSLILGRLGKLPSEGIPYPVFVYCGLLPWFLFSNSVTSSSQSIVSATHLIKKVYFPRLLIPISSLGVNVLDFIVSAGLVVVLMLVYKIAPSWAVLLTPILALGVLMLALGIGLILASMSVTFKDFRFIIPFILQIWMFATPVVYSSSLIPEKWRLLVYLNPMAGYADGFRYALLNGRFPGVELLVAMAMTIGVLLFGLKSFSAVERNLADEL